MKFQKTTIKDVAKALGVSTSTVSRALRDSYEIGEDTKKRVVEYSESINFKPNQLASSLKARTSKSIGIVVSEIANSFFAQVMNGIESVAHKKGYNVIVTQTHGSSAMEVANISQLIAHSVDGILISLSSGTTEVPHLKELVDKHMPLVFFDRVAEDINTHKVVCDNFKGAFESVDHLAKSGYKRIGFLGSAPHLSNIKERYRGYIEALKQNNLEINDSFVKFCSQGCGILEEAELVLDSLIQECPKPDALLICGDTLTAASLKYFKRKKIRIPEDIAIVCFSNQELAEVLNPSLTTIYQPAFDMGCYAAELLFQLIKSKNVVQTFETKKFNCQLNIRESI